MAYLRAIIYPTELHLCKPGISSSRHGLDTGGYALDMVYLGREAYRVQRPYGNREIHILTNGMWNNRHNKQMK